VDLAAVAGDIERVIVTEEALQARIKELAAQVDKDYAGKDLLLIGVLKGAVMAVADLSRALQRHVEMDWMAVSSYGSGTKSSGVVRILKDLDRDITGRNVLIVEDIVDSGLTLSWLKSNLESRGVGTVEILSILRKPEAAKVHVDVKYVGFEIPPDRDITGRNVLIVEDIVDSGLTLSWLKSNLESRGVGTVEILSILRKPEAAKVHVDVKYVGFEIPPDFVVGYGLDFDEKYRNLPFIAVLAKHMYS